MVRSASVQPLCRAVLVEQAHGDGPRGDARVAGQLRGRVREQCRDAPPPERPGHCDPVNQRNAAAPESGMAGLPHDPSVSDDVGTARGDQARVVRLRVIGQIPPRLGLAVTHPLDERPDGRLGIALVGGLDGDAGNARSATLAYAERRTLVPL